MHIQWKIGVDFFFFFTTITNSNEYLNQQQCLAADKFRRTSKTPDVTSRNNNNTNEYKNKKITILNTFYCVTECLSLTISEQGAFPHCRFVALYTEPQQSGCRSLAPFYSRLRKISEANGFRKSGRISTRQITLAEEQA